jgi:hypothetical protein
MSTGNVQLLSKEDREQALAVIGALESICKGKTGGKFRGHLQALRMSIEHRNHRDAKWLAQNFEVRP